MRVPQNLRPQLPPGHSGLFMPVDQQIGEEVTILFGEIFLNYHEALGLQLHNGSREELRRSTEAPHGTSIPDGDEKWETIAIIV